MQFNGPGAGADDRVALALRPPARPARPGHPRAGVRRGTASCAACARTTRRVRSVTRCSTSARSPGSATCGRSRAASPPAIDPWRPAGRVSDDEVLRDRRRAPAAHAALGARTAARPLQAASTAGPGCPARAAGHADPARGQGDDNRPTSGARRARRDRAPRRPQGRRPHRAGQHARVVRRGARRPRRHDRVRRPPRGPGRPGGQPAAARARLRARSRPARSRSRRASRTSPRTPFAGVELDVDLKLPGYEARVLDALRAHGLLGRALVSTLFMRSLVTLRELEPALRLGWSVPRVQARLHRARGLTMVPAYGAAAATRRRRLPGIAAEHVRAGPLRRAHGPPAARHAAARRGAAARPAATSTCGRSTTPRRSAALEALGVTGVITNDPRLFGAPALGDRAGARR